MIKKRKAEIKEERAIKRNEIILSDNNRLSYIYKINMQKIITEIVCVSLEIKIKEDWLTIIYYDSHHDGILHRHTRSSIQSDADFVDYFGVKRKGDFNKKLHWAIDDIKHNYLNYKKQFIKSNKKFGINLNIDLF